MHQLHFGRLDTAWNGNCSEVWYSVSRMTVLRLTHLHCRRHWMPSAPNILRSGGCVHTRPPKMCGARSRPRLHEGSIDLTGVGLDIDEAPSIVPLLL